MPTGEGTRRWIAVHPLVVRLTHWVNVVAMTCMTMSGWLIYNASPLFDFTFPRWATLGGWLGAATVWHFAAMWLLVANGAVYLGYGLLSGHFRRALLPLSVRAVLRDLGAALRLRLDHAAGRYNAVQRACYIGVLLLGLLIVASGLAIWKPVQLAWLTTSLGGYEAARYVHFFAMSGILLFLLVHLSLVLIVPKSLLSMITGRVRATAPGKEERP